MGLLTLFNSLAVPDIPGISDGSHFPALTLTSLTSVGVLSSRARLRVLRLSFDSFSHPPSNATDAEADCVITSFDLTTHSFQSTSGLCSFNQGIPKTVS